MPIVRHPSAGAFLAATEAFRAAEPLLTNVMASVATSVVAGRHYASELWLTMHASDGRVAGMAMRTAPWNLWVSPMPGWAADELGGFVTVEDPGTPGVIGPEEPVAAVVAALSAGGRRRARTVMVDVLRVLTDFRPPPPTAGRARRADARDIPLLVDWNLRFAADAGLPTHGVEDTLRQQVENEAMWLWEVDDVPVSMAGHANLVPTPAGALGRVGPVYTEPDRRGHGYGSAATSAVVEALLPRCASIMLFADAAKPEINRMYNQLGFEDRGRVVEVELSQA